MSVYHWCILKKYFLFLVVVDISYFWLLINIITMQHVHIYIYIIIHHCLCERYLDLSLIPRVVPKLSFPKQIQSHLELSKADNEGNSQREAFKNLRVVATVKMDQNVAYPPGNGYISHLGKRKIIFKMPFLGGYISFLEISKKCSMICFFNSPVVFLNLNHWQLLYLGFSFSSSMVQTFGCQMNCRFRHWGWTVALNVFSSIRQEQC